MSRVTPSANAWPDGSIFVSTGLMDLLDDDELTAAIAHEMGHLPVSADGRPAPSLAEGRRLDIEERADAAGFALLRRAHLSPAAMARALRKVERRCPHAACNGCYSTDESDYWSTPTRRDRPLRFSSTHRFLASAIC